MDGALPIPASTWMNPNFDDSLWRTANSSFGHNAKVITTMNNGSVNGSEMRRTYYFRKTVNLADGSCYANVLFQLLNKDGSVSVATFWIIFFVLEKRHKF